jgi:hypothetical protein
LYVRQPAGFVAAKQDHLVCKFHKGLHGLKQSSRLWNAKFDAFIVKFGLTSTISYPCVYTHTNANELILHGIWVSTAFCAVPRRHSARRSSRICCNTSK